MGCKDSMHKGKPSIIGSIVDIKTRNLEVRLATAEGKAKQLRAQLAKAEGMNEKICNQWHIDLNDKVAAEGEVARLKDSDSWRAKATEFWENGNCPICFGTDEVGHTEKCIINSLEDALKYIIGGCDGFSLWYESDIVKGDLSAIKDIAEQALKENQHDS